MFDKCIWSSIFFQPCCLIKNWRKELIGYMLSHYSWSWRRIDRIQNVREWYKRIGTSIIEDARPNIDDSLATKHDDLHKMCRQHNAAKSWWFKRFWFLVLKYFFFSKYNKTGSDLFVCKTLVSYLLDSRSRNLYPPCLFGFKAR